MHISDVHDYGSDPEGQKIAQDFIAEGRRKQIKGVLEQLVDDEFERLEQYAEEFISQKAAYRAEKFLERVLRGDKDAAMALLGDRCGGSRYHISGPEEGKPWSNLIHGSLFETQGVALRRMIAEANADLIRNERIADLESVVEGLTQQVRKLANDLEQCRMRL